MISRYSAIVVGLKAVPFAVTHVDLEPFYVLVIVRKRLSLSEVMELDCLLDNMSKVVDVSTLDI